MTAKYSIQRADFPTERGNVLMLHHHHCAHTVPGCRFCDHEDRVADTLAFAPKLAPNQCVYRWAEHSFLTIDKHLVTSRPTPYFLAIPYEHYTSFRMMPQELTSEIEDHIHFSEFAVRSDRKTSGLNTRIIFEHGQSRDGNKVKSIYHAHLHVLFGDFPAEKILAYACEEMRRIDVPFQVIDNGVHVPYLETLYTHIPDGQDYLYFQVNSTKVVAIDEGNDQIYSQFFRQILARCCGDEFINWKTATEEENDLFRERLYRSLPVNPSSYLHFVD